MFFAIPTVPELVELPAIHAIEPSHSADGVTDEPQPKVPTVEQGKTDVTPDRGFASAWGQRPFSMELHAGFATPVGGAGIMAAYSFVPWVSLACGVGTNFVGVQGACLARARLILRPTRAMYLGAGVSGGSHTQTPVTRLGLFGAFLAPLTQIREDLPPAPLHWSFAKWSNVEFGYESRKLNTFSVYGGVAFLLNADESWASTGTQYSTKPLQPAHSLIYGGVSLGWSI